MESQWQCLGGRSGFWYPEAVEALLSNLHVSRRACILSPSIGICLGPLHPLTAGRGIPKQYKDSDRHSLSLLPCGLIPLPTSHSTAKQEALEPSRIHPGIEFQLHPLMTSPVTLAKLLCLLSLSSLLYEMWSMIPTSRVIVRTKGNEECKHFPLGHAHRKHSINASHLHKKKKEKKRTSRGLDSSSLSSTSEKILIQECGQEIMQLKFSFKRLATACFLTPLLI